MTDKPDMEYPEDPDTCKTTRERHKPDWSTINIQSDGGELYIDVNCVDCGQSGCVGTQKTLTQDISW